MVAVAPTLDASSQLSSSVRPESIVIEWLLVVVVSSVPLT